MIVKEWQDRFFGTKDNDGKVVRVGDFVTWVDSDGLRRYDVVSWDAERKHLYLCNILFSIEEYRPFHKINKRDIIKRITYLEDQEKERNYGKG